MKIRKWLKKQLILKLRRDRGCSGFTLIEIIVAMIVISVLATMAVFVYTNYINKARITVVLNLLDNARKTLNTYNLDNGQYPQNIDFANGCVDENGRTVFPPPLCEPMNKDAFSRNYNPNGMGYILTARARDSKHTRLILTETTLTQEGK